MTKRRSFKTALDLDPVTEAERQKEMRAEVYRLLDWKQKELADAYAVVLDRCKYDPVFMERLLKDLRTNPHIPLRGPGRTKPPPWHNAFLHTIVRSLKGHRPSDICETIAISLNVSAPHARRLYDSVRKQYK